MVNDQSETERASTGDYWFGLDRLRLFADDHAIDVTIGSETHWDRSHLRRLRQSGDLPGMVPIIDSDFSADGKPFAVTPVVDSPTLASRVAQGDLDWTHGAGITEAAARAAHEGHLRGLFHGGLSPDDVYVVDNDDVAIAGVGLGLGGTPPADRAGWVAPEVREGAEPTERSDVYSLGKVLEFSLGEAIDTVPRSIRRLIMWSSSDTPEARPPSAMEFASILAEGLGEDRVTYGPAFIPTAETSDLASLASSAVSHHTPTETAQETASSGGAALGGIGAAGVAAAAGVGAAGILGSPDDDDGFSVAEAEVEPEIEIDPETDPGETIDDLAEVETEVETTPEVEEGIESSPIETVAASTGEHKVGDLTSSLDPDSQYAVPEAAQTIDLDETYVPQKRRNRAGLVIGAILGIGLALIAWGLLTSGDDSEVVTPDPGSATTLDDTETQASATDDSDEVAGATTTSEATASTTEATTSTTEATTSATEATTSTTAEPAEDVEQASPVPRADGPIAASDAGIQLLHGVPGTNVDVYIDGQAIATDFISGTIAGPMDMGGGDHEIALYSAMDLAPANAEDRTDQPLLTEMVSVESETSSVVAHLDEDGEVAISPFAEQLDAIDPGQGRVMIRHLMAAGEADAAIAGEIVGSLGAGEETAVEIDAGSVVVELIDDDGEVLAAATVAVDDGELVALSAIGSPADGSAELVIQRYTGLATAPLAVPTGDSGLLDVGSDETGILMAYILMAVLATSGGALAFWRQRSLR